MAGDGVAEDQVICETPTAGKAPVRIPRWKYEMVRGAIVAAVREGDEVALMDLRRLVAARLSAPERADLGSVGWHVTVVKLDLEVKGELERVPESRPQRPRLAGSPPRSG